MCALHTYIDAHLCVSTGCMCLACVHIWPCVCMYVRVFLCVCACSCACMDVYVHACLGVCVHV